MTRAEYNRIAETAFAEWARANAVALSISDDRRMHAARDAAQSAYDAKIHTALQQLYATPKSER